MSPPLSRLRTAWVPLVQAAMGAGVAWFLAHDVLGHDPGIFAPIGAMVVLSMAPERRVKRAVEVIIGAAIGVAIGDLLIALVGTGPLQVILVASLAMGAVTVFGAGPLLVTQAGIASVLIATVAPPEGLFSPLATERLIDIVIGGVVGLVASFVLPRHPVASVRAAAVPVFSELSGTLEQISAALAENDVAGARQALARARTLDGHVRDWGRAIELAEETARLAPVHRHNRLLVARHAAAIDAVELAVRDVRVLARSVSRATELETAIPRDLALAVRDLGSAVEGLGGRLVHSRDAGDARDEAIRAAGRASSLVSEGVSMPIGAVVAQVRSTATDLLRALGLEPGDAVTRVRTAADRFEPDDHEH